MSDPDGKTLGQRDAAHHLHPFTDNRGLVDIGGPTVIERGEGCYLWDDQMHQLAYYNPFFNTTTAPAAELAEMLAALMPGHLNTALFANSGSEVCDSAIRLGRYYWQQVGKPSKRIVIGREEGYYGSTLATISAGRHFRNRRRMPSRSRSGSSGPKMSPSLSASRSRARAV